MQINIYEAKAKLSNLLDRAMAGEPVVIARAGEPVVRLVPIRAKDSKNGVVLGALKGKIKLKKGFFDASRDSDLLGSKE
jgi:prevent-host-death family protein